jgi:Xaa-Pro aminopeptidase
MAKSVSKSGTKVPAATPETVSPHQGRLKRLAGMLTPEKLDFLMVTNPLDVAYLTGFLGGDSYLLVPGDRSKPILISDFRYQEELQPHAHLVQIVIRKRSMSEAVIDELARHKVGRLGIQADHMTVGELNNLTAAIRKVAVKTTLAPVSGLVGKMRAIKDETEIKLIRKAAKIQEKALEEIIRKIKPGKTELEVAGRLEAEMKALGSREPGFQSIVAAGANGSLPHYRPQDVKIRKNEALLIDWGAVYQGYHSDMTRVFALGKWPKKIKEIYSIVLDAQEAAAAALAPGKSTTDIDAIARNHIKKAGYGDYFGHGLGHGIGFNGHEEPRLTNMLAGSILQPGHVVTVEPGIYLPGIGGVRIEDDYVITDKGAENLCSLPKDMDWATI